MVLLGTSEVARRLGIHPFTLKRWDDSGRLVAMRDSSGKKLYTEEQITAFAQQRAADKAQGVAGC